LDNQWTLSWQVFIRRRTAERIFGSLTVIELLQFITSREISAPYIAVSMDGLLSYRSRRSALIPNDVSLSAEEEVIIADRIGYRPIPPPGAIESKWFTAVSGSNWAPKQPNSHQSHHYRQSASKEAAPDSLPFDKYWRYKRGFPLRTHCTRAATHELDPVETRSEISPGQGRRTNKHSRKLQFSWKIDIPHMSEVLPLGEESSSALLGRRDLPGLKASLTQPSNVRCDSLRLQDLSLGGH
jgi:hypothetical protein